MSHHAHSMCSSRSACIRCQAQLEAARLEADRMALIAAGLRARIAKLRAGQSGQAPRAVGGPVAGGSVTASDSHLVTYNGAMTGRGPYDTDTR